MGGAPTRDPATMDPTAHSRGPIWLDDRGTGQWKWLEEVPRRTSLVPLAFPCFVLRLIGLETKNVLDYQGRAGDHFYCTVERSPGHIRCRHSRPSEKRPLPISCALRMAYMVAWQDTRSAPPATASNEEPQEVSKEEATEEWQHRSHVCSMHNCCHDCMSVSIKLFVPFSWKSVISQVPEKPFPFTFCRGKVTLPCFSAASWYWWVRCTLHRTCKRYFSRWAMTPMGVVILLKGSTVRFQGDSPEVSVEEEWSGLSFLCNRRAPGNFA